MRKKLLVSALAAAGALASNAHAATYQETNGIVVVEAVHFDDRTAEAAGAHHYVIVPDEDPGRNPPFNGATFFNSRTGHYVQNIPAADQNRNSGGLDTVNSPPYIDYKFQINDPGTYQLYVRGIGFDDSDDSGFAQILELEKAVGGPGPDWYRFNFDPDLSDFSQILLNTDDNTSGNIGWDGNASPEVQNAGGGDAPCTWTISKPGVYTLRWSQREAGNAIDAFVFQLSTLPPPPQYIPESLVVGAAPPSLQLTGTIPAPKALVTFDTPVRITFLNGTTTLDQNSVVLKVDNNTVTFSKTNSGPQTFITYQFAQPLPPSSPHTVSIDYKDNTGKAFNDTYSFNIVSYVELTKDLAVTPDTSKPGFICNWSEVDSVAPYPQNSIARTEAQLAGLLGPNTADPTVQGPALAQGKQLGGPNSPFFFEIPTVINMDKAAGDFGHFTGRVDQEPGAPGTSGSTDNQAAEFLTYITFPTAGVYVMGVTSDDGFKTTAGAIKDIFAAQLAGIFDGGRGSADTAFKIVVANPGTYPFRTVWENGGGDSRVAWWTSDTDAQGNVNYHLINDAPSTDPKALKSYRAATGAAGPAYISLVSPPPNSRDQYPTNAISATIVDAATTVNAATVKLTLDGAALSATATKNNGTTTISSTAATGLASGAHTVTLSYSDNSAPPVSRTVSWTFTTRITEKVFVAGTLFIEAEDFNFSHGQYITNQPTGMTGAYPGGAYAGLGDGNGGAFGDGSDYGIDYNTDHSNNPQAQYRPDTAIAAGKTNGPAGFDRGTFSVQVNHVVGWNDAGDWLNFTRVFPATNAAGTTTYNAYMHLASGGADEDVELAQIMGGATTTNQVKQKIGEFKARATGDWDTWHIVALKDQSGNLMSVNIPGGPTTLRLTIMPGSNEDMDYLAFVPLGAAPPSGGKVTIALSTGKINITWSGTAALQTANDVTGPWTDVAGASSPYTAGPSGKRAFFRLKQ